MPLQSLSLCYLANPRVRTVIGAVRQRLSATIGLHGAVIGIMYGIFTHVMMGFLNTRLPTPQSHHTVRTLHTLFHLFICCPTSNPTTSAPRCASRGSVFVESGFFGTKTIASTILLVSSSPTTITLPLPRFTSTLKRGETFCRDSGGRKGVGLPSRATTIDSFGAMVVHSFWVLHKKIWNESKTTPPAPIIPSQTICHPSLCLSAD